MNSQETGITAFGMGLTVTVRASHPPARTSRPAAAFQEEWFLPQAHFISRWLPPAKTVPVCLTAFSWHWLSHSSLADQRIGTKIAYSSHLELVTSPAVPIKSYQKDKKTLDNGFAANTFRSESGFCSSIESLIADGSTSG